MKKVLFDTSVIVAGLWLEHPEHQKCLPWLQQVQTRAQGAGGGYRKIEEISKKVR